MGQQSLISVAAMATMAATVPMPLPKHLEALVHDTRK